jgi:hypothetical protein
MDPGRPTLGPETRIYSAARRFRKGWPSIGSTQVPCLAVGHPSPNPQLAARANEVGQGSETSSAWMAFARRSRRSRPSKTLGLFGIPPECPSVEVIAGRRGVYKNLAALGQIMPSIDTIITSPTALLLACLFGLSRANYLFC